MELEQDNRARMNTVQKDHETKLEQNQLRIKNLQRDLNLLKKFNQVQQQQLQNIKIEEDNAFPAAIPLPAKTTPVSVDFLLADYYFYNITGHL